MADDDAILRATRQQLQETVNAFSASSDRISRTMRDSTNGLSTQFYRLSSTSNLTSSYVEHLGKTAAAAGGITGDLAKEFLEIDRAVGIFAAGLEDAANGFGKVTAGGNTGGGSGDDGSGGAKALFGAASDGMSSFINGLTGGVPVLGSFTGVLRGTISPLTLLGAAFGAGTDVVMDNFHGWREATKAGAMFGASMMEYGHQVAETRLNTGQFNKILGDTSNSLSMIGGTVSAGTEQFSRLAGMMRSTQISIGGSTESIVEQMSMLGISTEESAELVGSFLSRQSMAATISSMSQQELAETTANYMNELTQLSMLTGKNRKAIADEIAAKEKDAQFRAMLAGLDADQRAGIGQQLTMMKNLYGPEAEEVIQAAFAGVPVQSEKAMALQASEFGQILSKVGVDMRDIAKLGGDPGEAFTNNVDALNAASDQFAESIRGLAMAGVEGYDSMYVTIADANVRFQQLMEEAVKKSGDANISMVDAMKLMIDASAGMDKPADTLTKSISEAYVIGDDVKAGLKKAALATAETLGNTVVDTVREKLGDFVDFGFDNAKSKALADSLDSTIPLVNSTKDLLSQMGDTFRELLGIEARPTKAEIENARDLGPDSDSQANYIQQVVDAIQEGTSMSPKLLEIAEQMMGPNAKSEATIRDELISKYANDPNILKDTAKLDEFLRALREGRDTENDLIKDSMEKNLSKDGKPLAALLHELLNEQKSANQSLIGWSQAIARRKAGSLSGGYSEQNYGAGGGGYP